MMACPPRANKKPTRSFEPSGGRYEKVILPRLLSEDWIPLWLVYTWMPLCFSDIVGTGRLTTFLFKVIESG